MESVAANGSKIRLLIYQFAFLLFFFAGAIVSCLKESTLASLFVVDFGKVHKTLFESNTDESFSTVLIKNGLVLYYTLITCKKFRLPSLFVST